MSLKHTLLAHPEEMQLKLIITLAVSRLVMLACAWTSDHLSDLTAMLNHEMSMN